MDGKKAALLKQMQHEMQAASQALEFERAARLRDEIRMLETLDERGDLDTHAQPEVFYIDPKKGLAGLRKVLKLDKTPAHRRRHRHRAFGRRSDGGQRGAIHRWPTLQAGLPAVQDPQRGRCRRLSQHPRSGHPSL